MIIKLVNKSQITKVLALCSMLIILTGCAALTPEDDRFSGEFAPEPGVSSVLEPDILLEGGVPLVEEDVGPLESQCGKVDESQDVESYDGKLGVTIDFVSTHQEPVGLIQWNDGLKDKYDSAGSVNGRKWCSGTLIANDLFLTAAHCFDNKDPKNILPKRNGDGTTISPSEIAENMHVNFNYQLAPDGNKRTPEKFAITRLEEYELGGLDFAVVRLDGDPGSQFGITPISSADAEINDMLAIIGHPVGRPKKIEAGPAMAFTSTRIKYNDVDTLRGNSGSGILHSEREEIVGVHTNGGCDDDSPGPGGGFNSGIRISAILNHSPIIAFLAKSDPDVKFCEGSAISEGECNVLVNLYTETNGLGWLSKQSWLETDNHCEWHGVTCDEEQNHVVALRLPNNKLKGNIPENLGLLEKLEVLELGDAPKRIDAFHVRTPNTNALSGSIPASIGNLKVLRTLNLSNNFLTGSIPDTLGELSQLTELYLEQNQLSDPIPDSFNGLTLLDVLALNNNNLSGSIPDLSQLDLLTHLRLHNNEFSRSIPGTLGDLDSLQHLYLYDSPIRDEDDDPELRLTGSIPEGLMGLKDTLRQLSMHSHKLSGTIPSELGEFEQLETLHLGANEFTGPIPPELGNLENLVALGLNINKLTGGIPKELGKLTKLRALNLSGNPDLGGEIPSELGDMIAISGLQLGDIGLSGTVPDTLFELPNWCRPELAGNRDLLLLRTNPSLSGRLPVEFKDCPNLQVMIQDTNICVPNDSELIGRFETDSRWLPNDVSEMLCSEE